ncbi:MAG: DinB family protein [Dehalococcoidia bacterium]
MNSAQAVQQQLGFWHGALDNVMGDCGDALNKELPGATVTSIAAIYAHLVFAEDTIVNGMIQGKPPIYPQDGREATTGVPFPGNPGMGDWAKGLQMNYPAFQEYAKEVFANTDVYLSAVSEADLQKKVQTPAGEQPVEWVVVTLLGTHAPQHIGEIAALKGVQGLKGLPF